jgi:nicotinamidase/pyrazinamidase
MQIEPTDALIVVDPQNDFLPGGSLAVPDGNRILEPINALMPHFGYVVASRDWHPRNHAYFQANGGPWPWHCLARTFGAQFSPLLHTDQIDDVVSKGTDPKTDGYSAFADTDLSLLLRKHGVRRVFVCGLATDYCVKATTLEAIANGFDAVVIADAIAGIDVKPGDVDRALDEMRAKGAQLIAVETLLATK